MISEFTKFFSLILVFFIINGSLIIGGSENKDLKKIGENITDCLLSGEISQFTSSDLSDADEIISRTVPDENGGLYFSDIDYENGERSSWPAAKHVGRTERLAILYRKETDAVKKEEYKKCVLSLLDHWIEADYQNSNWWFNRLSHPNALGEIGILMKSELSRKQLLRLSELVGRGSFTVSTAIKDHTGANASDLAMSTIKFGVLTGSTYAVKKAVKVVLKDLQYSDGEGLKADSTFFQHGNRIYIGGYGAEYINGITSIMNILKGTKYCFTSEQLTPFVGFILDGMRIMSYGNTLDRTTMGRSVSRKNAQPLNSIVNSLEKLLNFDEVPRKEEIRDYIDSIKNNTKSDYGIKWFDVAKILVINNDGFYFSFKGGDNDMVYSEIINSENVLSYNSSFPGITTIMHTGNEYRNVSPIYDYSLIPGATAVYETDEELIKHEDYTYRNLKGIYGSKTDENAAVVFNKTSHEGIDMTVTCFATGNSALILGAGMRDSQGRPMNTAVDQCNYAGDFEIKDNTVWHNSIKYEILDGGKLTAKAEHRTGNWKRNNLPLSDETVEGDIFTVSIENTGKYAYSVMEESCTEKYEVIVNNEKVQAVLMPDGRIAAAFFENGSFDYSGRTFSGTGGNAYIY